MYICIPFCNFAFLVVTGFYGIYREFFVEMIKDIVLRVNWIDTIAISAFLRNATTIFNFRKNITTIMCTFDGYHYTHLHRIY
jgi:hypothetical protein